MEGMHDKNTESTGKLKARQVSFHQASQSKSADLKRTDLEKTSLLHGLLISTMMVKKKKAFYFAYGLPPMLSFSPWPSTSKRFGHP